MLCGGGSTIVNKSSLILRRADNAKLVGNQLRRLFSRYHNRFNVPFFLGIYILLHWEGGKNWSDGGRGHTGLDIIARRTINPKEEDTDRFRTTTRGWVKIHHRVNRVGQYLLNNLSKLGIPSGKISFQNQFISIQIDGQVGSYFHVGYGIIFYNMGSIQLHLDILHSHQSPPGPEWNELSTSVSVHPHHPPPSDTKLHRASFPRSAGLVGCPL